MRPLLLVPALLTFSLSAHAEDRSQCYMSAAYPHWTLTEATTKFGAGFIWHQGDKRIELSTGSIGTGIIGRMATEAESGRVHTYLYVRDVLVFDMVPYEPGCPNDRIWVDRDCKRVLISQGNAWSGRVTYNFIDEGQPVTSCEKASYLQDGPILDLECGSGRKIKLETNDFLTATVDGVEMRVLEGKLPCSSNYGQPPGLQ